MVGDKRITGYEIPMLEELTPTGAKEADYIPIERYTGCKSGPVCGPGYCPRRR